MAFTAQGATELDALIPEHWGRMNRAPLTKTVGQFFFDNVSTDVSESGDTVNIATLDNFTANDRTAGSIVDTNTQTLGVKQVTKSTYKNAALLIDISDMKSVIMAPTQLGRMLEKLRDSIEYASETSIFADCDFTKTVGASTAAIQDSYLREAMAYMNENDYWEASEMAWFFNSAAREDLLGIDRYTLVDEYGDKNIMEGRIDKLYGAPVYYTNRLPANTGLLAHKSFIAYAHFLNHMDNEYIANYSSYFVNALRAQGEVKVRDIGVRILHA